MKNSIFAILSVIVVVLTFSIVVLIMNYQMQQTLSPSVQDCINRGGTYQIIDNQDGSQTGTCVFASGATCTDDKYYSTGCYPTQIVEPQE